jgi:iron complex outermembrane receptor protein
MWLLIVVLGSPGLLAPAEVWARAPDVRQPQSQTVSVRVTSDGRPVAGARVRLDEIEVRTEPDGVASLTVTAGAVEIMVDADGFVPATVRLPASLLAPIDVMLEPLAEFEEEIVVSASRSPTRLQDQPLRVEVIDREEIEEKALMTPGSVAMLIGETTGLRVQPTAPSLGAANVRIQGLRGRYSQLLAEGLPLYGGQGDSFSLLQVPPLDLGQVEIIKGVASALYGASALGGVINLVSRRPMSAAREVMLNATSLGGTDTTVWLADVPSDRWRWSVLGGFHRQGRRDLDHDGWTDVSGYDRGMVRPRFFFDNGTGTTVVATAGVMVEDRDGGTLPGRVAPDGQPFAESLWTGRGDAGVVARWLISSRVISLRGSYGRQSQDRHFGEVRERGTRDTGFGEVSLQGASSRHTWVFGGAFQHDGYRAEDFPDLDYSFDVPAVFAQDELTLGPARLAVSGRLDVHDEYGVLASPRASLLWRPDDEWTMRLSAGGGAFAPTPFVEDTDETGFSRLNPLVGLDAERAWSGSLDVTRRVRALELSMTWFASRVTNPIQFVTLANDRAELRHADGPTRTWGSEALGRYRAGPLMATATYAYIQSSEVEPGSAGRRDVPLTPRHYTALDVMAEDSRVGRAGVEVYYVGRQTLEDNPYRDEGVGHWIVGALVEKRFRALRVFVNAENLGDVRQTKYDPLVRPVRHPDGRWTVDAWAPLDGRVVNGGVRVFF